MSLSDREFEQRVREAARIRWPAARGGAVIIDGRERDGVFVTEDVVYCLEATTSQRLDKVRHDTQKLKSLIKKIRRIYPYHAIRAFIITKNEPTADQRSYVSNQSRNIKILSYTEFLRSFADVPYYLYLREQYPFGSVSDPDTGRIDSDATNVFVDPELFDIRSENLVSYSGFLQEISRCIILGDYGIGKSMILKNLFHRLAEEWRAGRISTFPIHLNLRDHSGDDDPDLALHRHANKIGLADHTQLVRAWRAGLSDIILDGFDELAPKSWGKTTQQRRQARYDATQLIRKFVSETPSDRIIIVAGRAQYFDSYSEMINALGIRQEFRLYAVREFDEFRANEYLKKMGYHRSLPDWIPRRPLLLGYLASKGFLEMVADATESEAGQAWHWFLERLSKREAERVNQPPEVVREVIDRVGTKAGTKIGGVGPLSARDLEDSFFQVMGHFPEESVVLLQRLPGLTPTHDEEGNRQFVDKDFADVARAGDILRFVYDPFGFRMRVPDIDAQVVSLGDIGVSVVAHQLFNKTIKHHDRLKGKIGIALEKANDAGAHNLIYSLLKALIKANFALEDGGFLNISEIEDETLNLMNWDKLGIIVQFQDCVFEELQVPWDIDWERMPKFQNCYFERVKGIASVRELPDNKFDNCTFGELQKAITTDQIMEMEVPRGIRVMLSVLKKLYAQSGHGRREGALWRGLGPRDRELVIDILRIVQQHGFARPQVMGNEVVWLPNPEKRKEALEILEAPRLKKSHPILKDVEDI